MQTIGLKRPIADILWLGFWVVAGLLLLSAKAHAKTVRYELTATQEKVNLSGKETVDFALAVNGTIPAPTLEFTEGDDAEIVVRNRIPSQELSIHWHGILLPPEMDGVPYVTTPTIHSGESLTFRFRLRQSGTYWYHSHTNVQEQKGVYGAFIIRPREKKIGYDKDVVAVLSDWSDENATSILKNLRKDGDYYLYKKGTMRSWLGAIEAGTLGNFLGNEWTRMGGMDYSDVGYDAFLINGKRDSKLIEAKPGEKVRIRIINAAASTYFHIALGRDPMRVVSADGLDIDPVLAKEILIGMAETYDLLFEIPASGSYELKITAQDGTGTASTWIGTGEKVSAPVKPFPDMYATMDHGGHGDHAKMEHGAEGMDHSKMSHGTSTEDHSKMDHGAGHMDHSKMNHGTDHMDHSKMGHEVHGAKQVPSIETLTVDELKARQKTEFPKENRRYDLKLVLDGDMSRYIWHINGRAIHQERTIEIREGDVVRFTFVNNTMMHHPMHLHGHFFRVLNKNGAYSPLKHTVDMPPHGTRTIEFLANEPGEWMLHCHNLYHLKTGMARVVKYLSYTPTKETVEMQKHDPHNHDHVYFYGMLEAATNHAQAHFRISQTWDQLDLRLETRRDFSWNGEGDFFYRRWFNRYFSIVAGATGIQRQYRAVAGVSYLLPMLVNATLLVDHKGEFRLDLEKRFQWSKYFFTDVDVAIRQRLESEFEVTLMYSPTWAWAGGLMVTEDSIGVGVQFQF